MTATPKPHAQWKGDNAHEFVNVLRPFEAKVERSGDNLLISGPLGLEIELQPGEAIVVDGDKIGIVRVKQDHRNKRKISVPCAHCKKPIEVYEEIYNAGDTLGITCGQPCYDAYVHSIRHILNNPVEN